MLLGVIRKWLQKRLGISLNIIPEYFFQATFDGTLLAQILLHYGIISLREFEDVEESRDPVVAVENYTRFIKEWLTRIECELTDEDIDEIVFGKGTAAASLMYDLYMKLENTKGTIFGMKTRGFRIEKVNEASLHDVVYETNPLCEPLMKGWDIINWERDHMRTVMKKYVESRESYQEYLETKSTLETKTTFKQQIEDTLRFVKDEETDYTYEQLIAQQQAALNMEPFTPDGNEAKRILTDIKTKKKQRAERTAFRVQMQHQLMAEVWKKIEEDEEQQFDKEVCEKLLKQSQHEKEIAERLLDIRRQKGIMLENRKRQDELDQKRRDEEFVRRLFEESLQERMKFHEERVAVAEQHRLLYAEKLRLKALKHEKMCKEAVDDITALSLKNVEYKKTYGLAPDEYLQKEWATLFVKQQPIFDIVAPVSLLKREAPEDLEEIYRSEFNRQNVLDDQELEDYLTFQKIWSNEGFEEFAHLMELGMNCLGYAVHKLLLKKYPLPIPEKPGFSEQIEISVCVNNMPDMSRLEFLRRLLELRSVRVIHMEDAVGFCIKAYEGELKTEFDEPFPEEEYLREVTPMKTKSERGTKKGKKEKKGQKGTKKGKKEKKGQKGKKGKDKRSKKDTGSSEVIKPSFEESEAQTPRLFPWEQIVFSNKAKLGRIAKHILGQGEVAGDKLLVDMFLEYLLSMPDIKGWVLLNWPNNYEQAALLEQALSGRPVPKQYYDEILNAESLTSVQLNGDSRVSSAITLDEAFTVEDGPPPELDPTATVESTVSAMRTSERRPTVSSQMTEFSEITMTESWNMKPKMKVAQILPDLVPLAYSDDEEIESEEVLEEEKKACTCECSRVKGPQQIDSPEFASAEQYYTSAPVEVISLKSEDLEGLSELQGTEEDTIEDEKKKGCVCYVRNEREVGGVENVEQTEGETQTDIAALEPKIDNERPLERTVAEDVYEDKRISKIVPNPRPLERQEYDTVLTAYIAIKQKEENVEDEYQIPCFKELEKVDGLEKFYCDQGCYYLLEYDEFNAETVKCLAKMIIGDYSLPLKSSVEIFGERYLEALVEDGSNKVIKKGKEKKKKKKSQMKLDKGKKDGKSTTSVKSKKRKKGSKSTTSMRGKKGKGSKSSASVRGKKGKGSKSSASGKGKKGKGSKSKSKTSLKSKKGKGSQSVVRIVEHEDKEVQVPTIEDEEEDRPEPKPGEENWEYVDLPIPSEIELSLATLWDNFEANYVKNFKELFFNKRVLLNDIVPFLAKTRETMDGFVARRDQKQHYLREFQKTLNEIGLDLRNDPETKSELFCLIDEFREKLLGICDTKMRESEEERRGFVRNNWLFRQFCEMTNTATIAFQMEIDRLVDTLQFLSDYYSALITRSPKEGFKFHKEILAKYTCEDQTSEAFNVLFIDTAWENTGTQFHEYVEETKATALAFAESMRPLAFKPVTEMKKLFEPEERASKKAQKHRKFEPDEDVKENSHRIFEEWHCAIDGEFARIHVHLNIIANEALKRFDDVISWIKIIFERIFKDISQRYENESASVFKACELLAESVEKEVIIQPELTFEGDHLAQIKVTLFPDLDTLPSGQEYVEETFRIEQLERMVKILFDLARDGFIMRKTFLLLIQDILYDDEDRETPTLWRNLSISSLNALLSQLFEDEKYLYWKDFIVCNLMIPFPTNQELMDVRKQFRSHDADLTEHVDRQEFDQITFWFDSIDPRPLKNIIFTMYQTDKDRFNYSAMLLDFCKDEDQVRGFVKALELSLGKFICYDKASGERFVTEILEDRILFEKQVREHEEVMVLAKRAVSLLIDQIFDEEPQGFDLREIEEAKSVESPQNSTESSKDRLISERRFSHRQIGFEARDDTELCFFLPLELVLIIVKTEVSWNCKVDHPEEASFQDRIVEIYEECRREKFNDAVLAHEFLHSDKLRELLGTTSKFLERNPVKLVKTILESSKAQVPEEFVLSQKAPNQDDEDD